MSTQQNRRFDALVFIGRFQPPHRGHLNVLKSALSRAERVCVLIGSTDKPRTIKDPFSFDERRQMLASLFDASSATASPSRRCRIRPTTTATGCAGCRTPSRPRSATSRSARSG